MLNRSYIKIEFIKYIVVSIISFIIDILIFTVLNYFLSQIIYYEAIILSTIIARIISSLFNYFANSRFIFKHKGKKIIFKYFTLVIIQMFLSSILVYLIKHIFVNTMATFIKILVDIFIFIINYIIQKKVIFK